MNGGQELQSQRCERKRVHISVALGPAFLPTPPGRLMTFYLPVYQVTDLSSELWSSNIRAMEARPWADAIFMTKCTITVHATSASTGIICHFYRLASN